MPETEPCPIGCGRPRPVGKLMCASCWREVPLPLQRDVYDTWAAYQRVRKATPWNPLQIQDAYVAVTAARDAAIAHAGGTG